jgi:hypothetical protein
MTSLTETELDDLWHSSWSSALAEAQTKTDVPIELWRTAGRPTKNMPNGEDLEWWRKSGRAQLDLYLQWREQTKWTIATYEGLPAIEIGLEWQFGDVIVKGFCDAAFLTEDGDAVVVDFKTGNRTVGNPTQLGLYATMISLMFDVPAPRFGAYYSSRKGELGYMHELTRFNERYFNDVFAMMYHSVGEGVFVPNLDSFCGTCAVGKFCYANGGIESHLYDPLDPDFTTFNQITTEVKQHGSRA